MKKQIIFFLVVTLFLASCERYQDAGIDLPYKNKLVAATFLAEGSDSVSLSLTRTQPVFGTSSQPAEIVTDADVYLHTSHETIMLTFDEFTSQYTGTLSAGVLSSGETCRISVSQNNEEVTGSTVIPGGEVPDMSLKVDSVLQDGMYVDVYEVRYKIQGSGIYNMLVNALLVLSDSSSFYLNMESGEQAGIQKINAGPEIVLRFKGVTTGENIHPVRIEIHPQICNDAYTSYHRSLQTTDYSVIGADGGEPVIIYSNMSNRIGIIAAYKTLPGISRDL